MTSSVALIIREPSLRNELAAELRSSGREVICQHHAEGINALLGDSNLEALVVGEALADADSQMLIQKARRARPDVLAAWVGSSDEGEFFIQSGEDTRYQAESTRELGRWLVLEIDNRPESETPFLGEVTSNRVCASSPEMQRIMQMVGVVAPTDSTVLLQGESGTGKDLFAHLLHQKSRRSEQPLVEVHCGAIPPSLMESELFGHEKGAFTGASSAKEGLCRSADGGTLFLDEIGELPLDMQVKLLRVLQSGWLRPVGSNNSVKVDLRVIAATNRDLREEVRAGRFRLDLFYRLNVISIPIPALRDRSQDIPELVDSIMDGLSAKSIQPVKFAKPVMDLLVNHGWPGNVRELENIIERLLLLFPDGNVNIEELRGMLVETRLHHSTEATAAPTQEPLQGDGLALPYAEDLTLKEIEDLHIRRILKRYEGNKTRAAQALGINVKTLYNKMKAAGIRKEDFVVGQP